MTAYKNYVQKLRKHLNVSPTGAPHEAFVVFEVYNMLDENIYFKNVHPAPVTMKNDFGLDPGLPVIICNAKDFCLLPHAFYEGSTKSGQPCKVVINRGNNIGIGNKLPSAPEVWKKSF